ncbi:hypothetical protein BB8028_0007g06080 [Beauveria bassiana]|uniref:Uncharacterized protein n=1 Tax=Beauveria bassiana TaxID=176275 RepID=A0A2S7YN13_BEABA|nr:hypothetical protein BB8028_0007g06080 [Beauveria bassiana]
MNNETSLHQSITNFPLPSKKKGRVGGLHRLIGDWIRRGGERVVSGLPDRADGWAAQQRRKSSLKRRTGASPSSSQILVRQAMMPPGEATCRQVRDRGISRNYHLDYLLGPEERGVESG